MEYPYQSFVDDIFSASNISRCENRVFSIQTKLDKAVADNDVNSIRELFNLLAKNSLASKVLSVWRITQRNSGKYTAGVDSISIPKDDRDAQYQIRLKLLGEIDITRKSDPIRRVLIPKSNGKTRPLGIPTLRDRINQEILRLAIEPIAEYHFCDNSFGFRPKRSCHDAIENLFKKLSRPASFRYVVEGDIKGCFDNIDHNHIINTLLDWKVPIWATNSVNGMLKSDIFHNGKVYDNDSGTPQGGVISPLLANVALTTLDNFCQQQYGRTRSQRGHKSHDNPIVRYADDFVIVCKSLSFAERVKAEITEHLWDKIGLTLSESKTDITHITKGFDFLGFNIRKYPKRHTSHISKSKRDLGDYTLLTKPQKEKVVSFLQDCKEVLSDNKSAKQETIIDLLNPKLRGWAMYYRHSVAKETFAKVDSEIWRKLFFWSKRRHNSKSKGWIINKYFSRVNDFKLTFKDNESGKYLTRVVLIPIRRHVIVNRKYRVYDNSPETREYWQKREYTNAYDQIHSVKLRKLFKRQKGKCSYCKEFMSKEQIVNTELHAHHMLPRSLSGTESHSNLRLLHNECHKEIHAKLSREEMKELWETKDYLLSSKR